MKSEKATKPKTKETPKEVGLMMFLKLEQAYRCQFYSSTRIWKPERAPYQRSKTEIKYKWKLSLERFSSVAKKALSCLVSKAKNPFMSYLGIKANLYTPSCHRQRRDVMWSAEFILWKRADEKRVLWCKCRYYSITTINRISQFDRWN